MTTKTFIKIRNSCLPYAVYRRLFAGSIEMPYIDGTFDLCIDGYPSSGNTISRFTVQALISNLTVASHYHNFPLVHDAVKLSIPTLVLIRNPESAITSVIVREIRSVDAAIYEYNLYYAKILKYVKSGDVHVAVFEDFVSDPLSYFSNKLFNIGFSCDPNILDSDALLEKLKINAETRNNTIMNAGVPSRQKDKAKQDSLKIISGRNDFKKCMDIYNTYIGDQI